MDTAKGLAKGTGHQREGRLYDTTWYRGYNSNTANYKSELRVYTVEQ